MSLPSTQKPAIKTKKPRGAHSVQGGTGEANRRAVAVLEVLGGLRTPADAAAALGIAVPRYYQIETCALEGMVTALEPRRMGKQPSLEGRLVQLQKELDQARRECSRQQALARVTQRSLGLKRTTAPHGQTTTKDRVGRRKRKPMVRALKAAAVLRVLSKDPRGRESEGVQQEATEMSGREATRLKASPEKSAGSRSKEEQPA